MLCLRGLRNSSGSSTVTKASHFARKAAIRLPQKRTFISAPSSTRSLFLSSTRPSISVTPRQSPCTVPETPLDILPKISTHPALAGIQVRCGPRNTFSPSHFVRKRRHGFLSRVRTRKGRATLKRRRAKGRSTLSH